MDKKEFDKNVFINCPYEDTFIKNILRPIIFCLKLHGLNPILALDHTDCGQQRIEKILDLMKKSRYSIHDLSKLKVKSTKDFARMNMPLELGMDYGLRRSGIVQFADKKFLILGSSRYGYMKAISDWNAFDIESHENKTNKVFDCLHNWLGGLGLEVHIFSSLEMLYRYMDFNVYLHDFFG